MWMAWAAALKQRYGQRLEKISIRLGSFSVSQVSSSEIVELIESARVPWSESTMLLTTARMLFKHACGRRLVYVNPCVGIELTALLEKRPAFRRRLMLTKAEIEVVFKANMNRENALAIRLVLATAVRPCELRTAKWDEFDVDAGVWTVPSSKTGPGIQIPITQAVDSWFRELRPLAGTSEYVFPVRGDYKNATTKGDRPINPIPSVRESPSGRRNTSHWFGRSFNVGGSAAINSKWRGRVMMVISIEVGHYQEFLWIRGNNHRRSLIKKLSFSAAVAI